MYQMLVEYCWRQGWRASYIATEIRHRDLACHLLSTEFKLLLVCKEESNQEHGRLRHVTLDGCHSKGVVFWVVLLEGPFQHHCSMRSCEQDILPTKANIKLANHTVQLQHLLNLLLKSSWSDCWVKLSALCRPKQMMVQSYITNDAFPVHVGLYFKIPSVVHINLEKPTRENRTKLSKLIELLQSLLLPGHTLPPSFDFGSFKNKYAKLAIHTWPLYATHKTWLFVFNLQATVIEKNDAETFLPEKEQCWKVAVYKRITQNWNK